MHLLYLQQLFIVPDSPGNVRNWEFARQWWESGWDITVCTTHAHLKEHEDYPHPKQFPYKWTYQGLDIYVFDVAYQHMMPFPKRILAFIKFYRQVLRQLPKLIEAPDAVLAYTAPLSVGELGRKLAEHWNIPFFLEVADVWPDVPIDMGIIRQPQLIKWLHKRTKAIYDRTQHIFPYSPDMKYQIEGKGVPSKKVTSIVNGTQIQVFSDRAMLHHPKGQVKLLYAGTIGIANDLSQLIKAIAFLEEHENLNIHLDIVGDGNDGQHVRKLSEELGVKSISFHPRVSRTELKKYWEEAQIGIVCFKAVRALQANGATKFFDYLASGIPVIVNYEGWQSQILKRYNCGLSSEQGNIPALARNIKFLTTYSTVRLRMGGNGRRLAQTQFNREVLARHMQEVIMTEMESAKKDKHSKKEKV
ncbi:MAG: glycosyltransferase family 4 protein [Bacteroidota bacterium]